MTEEWRSIPCAEIYQASKTGKIKGPSGKILTPVKGRNGYIQVTVCANGIQKVMLVHRLVALTFHGLPPSPKHHAAHIDGNRENNSAANLRWATAKENNADKKIHGTSQIGSRHGCAKLKDNDIPRIRDGIASGKSDTEIALSFAVSRYQIGRIRRGVSWSHVQ